MSSNWLRECEDWKEKMFKLKLWLTHCVIFLGPCVAFPPFTYVYAVLANFYNGLKVRGRGSPQWNSIVCTCSCFLLQKLELGTYPVYKLCSLEERLHLFYP